MIRLLFAIVLLLLAVGCSSPSTNGSNGTDAGASLDALVQAFCSATRSCCAASGAPPEPLADCETEFRRQNSFFQLAEKGTITIDPSPLARCVALIEQQSTTCSLRGQECERFIFGTLADESPCERVDECRGSGDRPTICLKTGASADGGPTMGICKAVPIGKEGDPCTLSCDKGESCLFTYTTSQTNPVLGTCREDDGLYCAGNTCVPLPADAAACPTGRCASASYCDTVCKPRKGEGAACASTPECGAHLTCANGACAFYPLASPKLCGGDYN